MTMKQWIKIWVPRALLALAALALFCVLARVGWLYLRYNWTLVTFPYSVDYGEGPILDQVLRLAHFENIYARNLEAMPYTVSNYPPGYLVAQLPFAWIFGPAFWYGRAISSLSVLAAVLFIALTLYSITHDWLAAAAGGLTLFAVPYILHWSPFNRVDSLALGLSWAGLFVITRWPGTRKGLIWSAILLTAAIFTRQSSGLAAPFAAFIWLLYQKPRRRAFHLAAWVAGMGLAVFILISLITRGGFFFNIVTANVNRFNWETVQNYADAIWEHMPYFVVGSGLFLAGAVWLRVKSWWLAGPYLLGAALVSITIGKAGSNVNYLFELSAAFSLAAGALIAIPGKRWWLRIVPILALAWQIGTLYDWTEKDYFNWAYTRATEERAAIAQLQKAVHEVDGPVLADEFMGLVPLDGRKLYFQPFEFKQLAEAKVWNEDNFIQDIRDQKFAMILIYDPPSWNSFNERWTRRQQLSIAANYIETGRFADTIIYEPFEK
jgi:hypothetical protein